VKHGPQKFCSMDCYIISKMPHPEPTETECWIWPGAMFTNGYGHIKWHGKSVKAHRLAFIAVHGPVPEGLGVLHKCNNKLCYNPGHLYAGTTQDNADDAVAAGALVPRRGEASNKAKLTEPDVIDILSRLSRKEKHADIAAIYSITRGAISQISCGKNWSHVPRPQSTLDTVA